MISALKFVEAVLWPVIWSVFLYVLRVLEKNGYSAAIGWCALYMGIKFFCRLCWDKGVEINHVASTDSEGVASSLLSSCENPHSPLGFPWHHPAESGKGHLFIPGWRGSAGSGGEVAFMDTAEKWRSGPLQLGGYESPAPSTRLSLSPPLWGSCDVFHSLVGCKSWLSTMSLLVWVGLQVFYVVLGWSRRVVV